MISRFQVDAVCLAETQINPALTQYIFSIRDKLFKDKESVSILSHNKQEHLGMRQQRRVFTGIIDQIICATLSTDSNSTELRRWNWVHIKGQSSSTHVITAYQCVKSRSTVETVFIQRERYLKQYNISEYPR